MGFTVYLKVVGNAVVDSLTTEKRITYPTLVNKNKNKNLIKNEYSKFECYKFSLK